MAEPGYKNNILATYQPDLSAASWIAKWLETRKNMPKVQLSLDNNPNIINSQIDQMAKYKIIPFTSKYDDGMTNGVTDHDKQGIAYNGNQPETMRVHERAHAVSYDSPQLRYIQGLQSKQKYRKDKNFLQNIWENILYDNNDEYQKYLDQPTEIYSRLMEIRKLNNINPKKVWTLNDIKKLRKNVKDKEIFSEYTDDFILKLFNEVAQNNNQNVLEQPLYAKNGTKINTLKRFYTCRKFIHGGKGVSDNGQYQKDDYLGFSGDMYEASYSALKNLHLPYLTHNKIVNLSRWIAMHKAMESGYGSVVSNNYNYGGYGGKNPIKFNSINDYVTRYVTDAQKLYPGIFKARNFQEYIRALFPEGHGYNPRDKRGVIVNDPKLYDPQKSYEVYWDQTRGMQDRVNQNIDEWIRLGYNK